MTGAPAVARRLTHRMLMVAAAVVVLLIAAPTPAQAHPTLLYTTPAADAAEPASPSTVVLVFTEPVTATPNALAVIDEAGRQTPVGELASGRQGRAVTARISRRLPVGVYTLRWRVTGADGDLVESSFRFAVGAPITDPARGASAGGSGPAWPAAALRWLLLAGLAVALGGGLGARITDAARSARPSLPPVSDWPSGVAAVIGAAATLGLAAWLAADAGLAALTGSTAGRALLAEVVAFTVAALLAATGARRWGWLPLLTVPIAEGARGHAAQAEPGWGALTTGVHVAAAALWLGALVHVVRTAAVWRAVPVAVWWTVLGYARWAAWLVAAVVATGIVSALVLVPVPAVTTTAYGRILLVKLAVVAAAAAAAVTARRRLRRGPDATPGLARAARVEACVLAGVLGVTAVLVSTAPAGDRQPALAPPPVGVVLPWATLAGQVGVALAASQGQVVVRLATPERGDYYTPARQAPAYRLSATVVAPGQPARRLRLRGCGEGCFVAPVAWGTGDNLLTVRAAATGWTGGTVSAVLPLPARPAPQRLAAAVAATNRAGPVTVYETVTSDTSTPPPEPTVLRLPAAAFVATEPYSAGIAPHVVALPADPGTARLAVGFPAEGRYAELVLDADNRIVDEILVDPKHLIRRRLVYSATR